MRTLHTALYILAPDRMLVFLRIIFGVSGIKEHGLTVVTYTAETDPDRETADTAAMYIDSDKINAAIGRIECVKVFADPVLKACERFDASTAVKFKISD